MSICVGVGNKARKVKRLYVGVNGKARKIKKIYIGVNGKARLCFKTGYGNAPSGLYGLTEGRAGGTNVELYSINSDTYAVSSLFYLPWANTWDADNYYSNTWNSYMCATAGKLMVNQYTKPSKIARYKPHEVDIATQAVINSGITMPESGYSSAHLNFGAENFLGYTPVSSTDKLTKIDPVTYATVTTSTVDIKANRVYGGNDKYWTDCDPYVQSGGRYKGNVRWHHLSSNVVIGSTLTSDYINKYGLAGQQVSTDISGLYTHLYTASDTLKQFFKFDTATKAEINRVNTSLYGLIAMCAVK